MNVRFVSSVFVAVTASGCMLLESFPDVATADASAIGADSGAFDPSALRGLALWLDGSNGVVTTVAGVFRWTDRANGNSAVQLERTLQPSLRAGALNGHAVVHFAGNDQFLLVPDSGALQFGTADFTVMLVVSWSNVPNARDHNAGYGALFVKVSPVSPFPGPALFANDIYLQDGSVRAQVDANSSTNSDVTTLNDGKFHVVGMRRSRGVLSVRADGMSSSINVNASFDVSVPGSGVYIGARDPRDHANQSLLGDIAEVVAIAGVVTEDQLGRLEAYFKSKYAL